MYFRHLPESIRVRTKCLASQDQTLRIFFQIFSIAVDTIVVSCNIHIGKSISCFYITAVKRCSDLHRLTSKNPCQIIEKFTSYCLFLPARSACFFLRLLVTVNAEANGT